MKTNRNLAEIAALLAILFVVSTLILAEEYNFTGTWKEWRADTGRNELGIACTAGCGLRILRVASVNKEKGSAKGKYGSGRWAKDMREANVMGNKLTFKTGKPPTRVDNYEAILNGEYLTVTWTPEGGGGHPQTFTMKRSK